MDGKFRLAFSEVGKTPAAEAYLADASLAFDRLTDAVKAGHERRTQYEFPYIWHRFTVLDPTTIGLLYDEIVNRPSSWPRPDSPC